MAAPVEVQRNAIGLSIVVRVEQDGEPVDLTGATTMQLYIKAPSGSVAAQTLVLSTTVTGQASYATQTGDLSEVGKYQVQGYFVLPSGFDGRTEVGVIKSMANLT